MTFTVQDVAQRSPEWFAARRGRLTGSVAADIMARLKSGDEAAARRNLRIRLALERVTGKTIESGFVSFAMQQGIEREPDARLLYEAVTGQLVETTGFLSATELMVGCSLDGHVQDFSGIIEIKCPEPSAHWEALQQDSLPFQYRWQVTHNLWVSGAQWCDWLSYQPDFPEPLQTKLVRVERNEDDINAYALAATLFVSEVDAVERQIQELAARYATTEASA